MSNENKDIRRSIAEAVAEEMERSNPGLALWINGGTILVVSMPGHWECSFTAYAKTLNDEVERRETQAHSMWRRLKAAPPPPTMAPPSEFAKEFSRRVWSLAEREAAVAEARSELQEEPKPKQDRLYLAGPPHMRDMDTRRLMKALCAPLTPEQRQLLASDRIGLKVIAPAKIGRTEIPPVDWGGQPAVMYDRVLTDAEHRAEYEAGPGGYCWTTDNPAPQHEETAMTENITETCVCGHSTRLHVPNTRRFIPCPKCHTLVMRREETGPVIETGHPCPDCAHLGDDAGFYVGLEGRETCGTCKGDKWVMPESPPATLPPAREAMKFMTRVASITGGTVDLAWPNGDELNTATYMTLRALGGPQRRQEICPIDLGPQTLPPHSILALMAFLYPESKFDRFKQAVTLDGMDYTDTEAFGFMLTAGDIGESAPKEPAGHGYKLRVTRTARGALLAWADGRTINGAEIRAFDKLDRERRLEITRPVDLGGERPSDAMILTIADVVYPEVEPHYMSLTARSVVTLRTISADALYKLMVRDGVFGDSAP